MNDNDGKVTVTFRFESADARREFIGQLQDGWGDGHCQVTAADGSDYAADAPVVDVEVCDE